MSNKWVTKKAPAAAERPHKPIAGKKTLTLSINNLQQVAKKAPAGRKRTPAAPCGRKKAPAERICAPAGRKRVSAQVRFKKIVFHMWISNRAKMKIVIYV